MNASDPRLEPLRDPALRAPEAFVARAAALDRLDFLLAETDGDGEADRSGARALRAALESVDAALFADLRARLRGGLRGSALRGVLDALVPPAARLPEGAAGYDALDFLLDGVLFPDETPPPTVTLEADGVALQQIPARVILELVDRAAPGPDARFLDIGSGIGRVVLLVALLTECAARGVELEPAYVKHARARAADVGLGTVAFVAGDAREAGLSGDVIFLYTPFRGTLLAEVLERLREQARGARVFAYGPCGPEIARLPGFTYRDPRPVHPDRLACFEPAREVKNNG